MYQNMNLPHHAVDALAVVKAGFASAKIAIAKIDLREYPDESIVVIKVAPSDLEQAIELANSLDKELAALGFRGFTTVKPEEEIATSGKRGAIEALTDDCVHSLVNLLTARSRTSEIQPSLEYIADAGGKISVAQTARHQLIFGRRGSGKTALLAETKSVIEKIGHLSIWMNLQTYRHDPAQRAFLHCCLRLCTLIQTVSASKRLATHVLRNANQIATECDRLLVPETPSDVGVRRLVPTVQSLLRDFLDTAATKVFIFLDDFHYVKRLDQPLLLDLLHGIVRDCDAWLKVATIKHLTRWYEQHLQLGLQVGHDAAAIDLDVTLQNLDNAKRFLESMLFSYAKRCSIPSLSLVFSKDALDRLVLASGAVPRDYLLLAASAIQQGQQRGKAKQVGVQDINKAAGEAKQQRVDELEEDAASAHGESQSILHCLQHLRHFCIDQRSWTYFRIDFQDKEAHLSEYGRLTGLLDLRLLHLVEPSLSDEHHAGQRSEVYMLDLSQFVGQRVKRKLNMLDFEGGHFVLKQTGTSNAPKSGHTPNLRLSILRRAPLFQLETLEE
jgi:hypothetical protein